MLICPHKNGNEINPITQQNGPVWVALLVIIVLRALIRRISANSRTDVYESWI